MPTVESWYWEFIPKLTDRVRRGDWPEPGAEFWDTLYRSLSRIGCTAEAAEEASQVIAEAPPNFLGEVIPALRAAASEVMKASARAAKPEDDSREFVRHANRDCECGGEGIAIRYRQLSARAGQNPAVPFYCTCPAGRWLKSNHASGNESFREVSRRMPDLAHHPKLQGPEYQVRPVFAPPAPGKQHDPLIGAFGRRKLFDIPPTPNTAIDPTGRVVAVPDDRAPWLAPADDGPAF